MQPSSTMFQFNAKGALLIPSVESPNYVAGSTGWAIFKNGTAEFNSATIRGSLVVGGTQLYYNGTPALGNLIASVSDSAGTDTYGNNYIAGITTYDLTNLTYVCMVNGQVQLGAINSVNKTPDSFYAANIKAVSNGTTTIQGASVEGVTGSHAPIFKMVANSLTNPSTVTLVDAANDLANFNLSGSITKTDATGNPLTEQTPTLGTGWAIGPAGGTVQNLFYTKNGFNYLNLYGAIHTTSTTPSANIFTLPSGYIPVNEQRGGVTTYNGTTITQYGIRVQTSGVVTIFPTPTATNVDLYFGMDVPLF